MNVRLKRIFNFSSGIIYDDEFVINDYTVTVHLTTATSNAINQNIAYERIKYWINFVLSDSILMSSGYALKDHWIATGQRILLLPDDPVDQLVGMMLFLKLSAIVQDNFVITDIEISSSVGDDMCYIHSEHDNLGPMEQQGWWNDVRPNWVVAEKKRRSSGGNVIQLNRIPEWKDLELEFDAVPPPDKDPVVFVDFSKDDKK
jgi:hypothetical protein